MNLLFLNVALLAGSAFGGCPFGFDKFPSSARRYQTDEYVQSALALDWDAVYADIGALFSSNHSDIYPPDDMLDGTFSYAPFFIRQAWHCSGSYRAADGLGGCSGGRQRFNPEFSWDDNTNLDKAKRLLWPIKEKYGLGLSWGDLMILAGKVAIETGDGPWIGFCAGRPDQDDGTQSDLLGPTEDQQKYIPCPVQGNCPYPFGADTIGLIYVNPGGFMDNYKLIDITAHQINITFGRMTMDAEETVALIGGGHAFGRTHGACRVNSTTFPNPLQNPKDPWPINACSNGTFTSGFNGYWTSTPRKFSNNFFQRLLHMTFEPHIAPGGRYQYQSKNAEPNKMMLPSDMSLLTNPLYQHYVEMYASNLTKLKEVFASAWYKLTTRDMGPITRCLNISIKGKYQLPPVQPFQFPLPQPLQPPPDYAEVKAFLRPLLYTSYNPIAKFTADWIGSQMYWGAIFAHMAFQCAATFRSTDHLGGCNGARIRLSPQREWVFNNGIGEVISWLTTAVRPYFHTLSVADLIVLAGIAAVEEAIGVEVKFCGGRSDAESGYPEQVGKPVFNYSDTSLQLNWEARVLGLTPLEFIALSARPRSANQMFRMGYGNGTWTRNVNVISNEYFQWLLNQSWSQVKLPGGEVIFQNSDCSRNMTATDMRILWHPTHRNIAQELAADEQMFQQTFVLAWKKTNECGYVRGTC